MITPVDGSVAGSSKWCGPATSGWRAWTTAARNSKTPQGGGVGGGHCLAPRSTVQRLGNKKLPMATSGRTPRISRRALRQVRAEHIEQRVSVRASPSRWRAPAPPLSAACCLDPASLLGRFLLAAQIIAVLISEMWEKAWGKFPSRRCPAASYSSDTVRHHCADQEAARTDVPPLRRGRASSMHPRARSCRPGMRPPQAADRHASGSCHSDARNHRSRDRARSPRRSRVPEDRQLALYEERSRSDLSALRKRAASPPVTTRWSKVSDNGSTRWTAAWPRCATTRGRSGRRR